MNSICILWSSLIGSYGREMQRGDDDVSVHGFLGSNSRWGSPFPASVPAGDDGSPDGMMIPTLPTE
ncbi:hypothetical protein Hanom_Chr04g00284341 [Helianthus anomalus]